MSRDIRVRDVARHHSVRAPREAAQSRAVSSLEPVSLSLGIVGLPNVGKSTLFNAPKKTHVLPANSPSATIEPNVGVVGVPDERLGKLAEIFGSEKVIPATVD